MFEAIGRAIRAGVSVGGIALRNLPAETLSGYDTIQLDGPAETWAGRLREHGANALLIDAEEGVRALAAATAAADGLAALDLIALPTASGRNAPLGAFLFDRGFVPLRGVGAEVRLYVRSDALPDAAEAGVAGGSGGAVAMTSLGRNGRFANQMFQYAFLRFYALRAGAHVEVPAWDGEELFALDDARPEPHAYPEVRFYDFDDDDRILWALDEPPVDVDFWGYFQELPESWRQHRSFLRRLFRLRPDRAAPLDAWFDRVTDNGRRPLVAVHVRRGDYVRLHREGLGWYRPIPEDWYVAWLRERLAGLVDPVVYVATDDPERVLPAFAAFQPLTAADAPPVEGLPEHVIDFDALRRAGHLAIANSSFSRMAALLAPDGQQVAIPDLRTESVVPYAVWDDPAFWVRFADGRPPDPAMGSTPAAVLRRGLRARLERGETLTRLHWQGVHAGTLQEMLAAAAVDAERLREALAAERTGVRELREALADEHARAVAAIEERDRRIADLTGALDDSTAENRRVAGQRDALAAELDATRRTLLEELQFQTLMGTPKWVLRRILLKLAFLGLVSADRGVGWMSAGLRARLRYIAGLIYDRRYPELSVFLRGKLGRLARWGSAPRTDRADALPDSPARSDGDGTAECHLRQVEPAPNPAPAPASAPAPVAGPAPAVTVMLGEREAFEAEACGWLNTGWYGNRELEAGERFWPPATPMPDRQRLDDHYAGGTQRILSLFGEPPADARTGADPYLQFGPLDRFHQCFLVAAPAPSTAATPPDAGFSVITPFFRHLGFFEECARSVAELFAHTAARFPQVPLEWVIANDDPAIADERLMERISPAIRDRVTVVPTGKAGSISAGLNLAIERSRHDWVLFLDCDDLIRREAIEVLRHYAARFPRCRYVSSSMVDIDDDGAIIRFRRHDAHPRRMLEQGMLAGHLKAVRRDAFADHGLLDARFDMCQDFEFVLRMMIEEPVLIVPEPLYFYRWHGNTQSVSRHLRQMEIHRRIQRHILRRLVAPAPVSAPTPAIAPVPAGAAGLRGVAIVRTRGTRLDLLRETVRSIAGQASPMTPVVVVHGDEALADRVRGWCADAAPGTLCLAADQPGRRRGYPVNVGIVHALENADRFDYVAFVDDDDILYPLAAERLAEALSQSQADVVYAVGNKRVPWQPAEESHAPLPDAVLLGGNFIPINTYAVRTATLVATGARFDETLEYLEDWDFLVQLLGGGARFRMLPETVSEFRMFGDGNTTVRQMPELFEAASRTVRARCAQTAERLGIDAYFRSLLDFEFAARPPLSPEETGMMIDARACFAEERDTLAA